MKLDTSNFSKVARPRPRESQGGWPSGAAASAGGAWRRTFLVILPPAAVHSHWVMATCGTDANNLYRPSFTPTTTHPILTHTLTPACVHTAGSARSFPTDGGGGGAGIQAQTSLLRRLTPPPSKLLRPTLQPPDHPTLGNRPLRSRGSPPRLDIHGGLALRPFDPPHRSPRPTLAHPPTHAYARSERGIIEDADVYYVLYKL